jgi:Fanconi-associated nuclease 1
MLLQRINLVYFRCTALSSNSILLPLILARSKKRKYPVYEATRTIDVFTSRDALIRYEDALRVEDEIEKASNNDSKSRFDKAKKVFEISQTVFSKWERLVLDAKESQGGKIYSNPGLERFEEGWQ